MSDPYLHEFPEEEEHEGRSSWRDRVRHAPRALVIAGLVALLAVGGAGVAFAAGSGSSSSTSNSSSSTSPTTTPQAKGPHGPFGRGGPGPFGRFGGLGLGGFAGGGVLHGTVTIRSGNGYKTVDIQVGTVTSKVGSTSITVQSADKFSQTYVVTSTTLVNSQAAGIGSVAVNDQVSVQATVSGTTATATNIVDITKIKGSRQSFGFGPPPGNGSSSSKTPAGNGSSSSNAPAGTAGVPGPGFGRGGPGPSEAL
jgi:hypothetical protein